jgi:dihydrofolate reductase
MLRVFESISVDGYFADAQADLSWAHSAAGDAEYTSWVSSNASGGGDLLLGRKTYQMMEAFWPTPAAAQQLPKVAAGMNAAKKHVATRTLEPTWANSHRLQGELLSAVRSLKESTDVTLLGSGELAAQLGAAGLVDEYQFVVVPVALGAGRTVFAKAARLRLVEQRAFRCGHVVLTYAT